MSSATAVTRPTTTPAPSRVPVTRRPRRQLGVKAALCGLVFVSMFPYLFMLVTSAKDNLQVAESYWVPTLPIHWENYATAWQQIQPYMIASLVVSVVSVAGIVGLSLVTGFILARFTFPGRTFFFGSIAALMMVPNITSLIPLFVMVRDFGMLNTYWVLILPHIATGCVLGTILMKTFIEGIPQELFDAARVDGATNGRIFTSIMTPLSMPVIGTVAVITINNVWNDFFWPLLTITENDLRTVSVGLLFFQGQSGTQYGPMFAGYLLASIPLLLMFTFLSKYFLAGVQGGLPGSH